MMHKERKEQPRSSRGAGLLVIAASCLVLATAAITESCTPTQTTETSAEKNKEASAEVAKENPTADRQEAVTPAETAKEATKEPAPEPAKEAVKEPALEPTQEARPDTTTPEPKVDVVADAGEPTSDAQDAGPDAPCTGAKPPYPDVVASLPPDINVPENPPADAGCKYKPGQCVGSDVPPWKLEDFQPRSCGFGTSYNLKAFKGYVTVVALLSAW